MRNIGTALFLCLQVANLFAKPEGFVLKSGEASPPIQGGDGSYIIQSGRQAIVEWGGFSIEVAEHVHFEQLDSSSYVLNRVVGPDESVLNGHLSSNGSVYLVNPNGILIGCEAHIDTAGFIASTLDLLNEDLSGKVFAFSGDSQAEVVNEGKIHSSLGDVFLIGACVENSGEIVAQEGRIGLLSGPQAWIFPEEAPRLHFYSVENMDPNLIEENPYALAIRQDGLLEAKEVHVVARGGIVQITGDLIAVDGDVGGQARILGDEIRLLAPACIDISAEHGGGVLLCGGDLQGQNPEIYNASRLFVESGVEINARAKRNGNGGKAIFWSDQATLFYGTGSIQGGEEGGDGGFAEVSGGYLHYRGFFDGKSLGKAGSVLLDPTNITISGSAAPVGGSFSGGVWTSNALTATIPATVDANSVVQQLSSTNVTINTSTNSGGPFPNAGTITISSAINWSSDFSLTLQADSTIAVNASVTNTSASASGNMISMTATGTSAAAGTSGITIPTGVTVSTQTGNIVLNGTSAATTGAAHGVSVVGTVSTTTGSITITGTSGISSTASYGVNITGSAVSVINSTSGAILVTGTSRSTANGSHGINTTAWTPATTDTVTLSGVGGSAPGNTSHGVNMVGAFNSNGGLTFTSCSGSSNGGHGVNIGADVSIVGPFNATNAIIGRGSNGFGFNDIGSLTVSGSNQQINITATAQGTLNNCHGVVLSGNNRTIRTTGGGSISIYGTSGNSGVTSYGVLIGSNISTTTGGDIIITGIALSNGNGIQIGTGFPASISSSTGNINLTGSSTNVTTGGSGVVTSTTTTWTTGTSGTTTISGNSVRANAYGVVIGAPLVSGPGDLVFSNCTATGASGTGLALSGISGGSGNINATGNVTATNTIRADGAGGVGFASNGYSISVGGTNKNLSITASSTGTTGNCYGLNLSGASVFSNTSGGSIALDGTGGPSSSQSHGINLIGTTTISTSNGGAISLTGRALSGGGVSYGVNLAGSASMITSSIGAISITGNASLATGAASHGVALQTAWSPATTGLLTLSGIGGSTGTSHGVSLGATFLGGGDVTFSTCTGGSSGGDGINVGASFSTAGTVTATSSITASGAGSSGFVCASNFETTGNSHPISITATASGTSGNCYGISLTGGTLSTTGSSSPITLIGTGGASSSLSHGINISGTTTQITTLNGAIFLTGTASGSAASCGVSLATSASPSISSALSTITISGTSTATLAGAHGVTITTALSVVSQGLTQISGTGGATGASHGVNITAAITNSGIGGLTLNGTAGGGAGSTGNYIGANLTTSGGAITVSSPALVGATVTLDTTNGGGVAAGNNITFSNTVNGANPLTLTCGSSGTATFNGTVGSTTPLTTLTVTANAIAQNVSVTTTGAISYTAPTLIAIGGNMTTAGGTIGLSGPVTVASAPTFDTTNGGAVAAGATVTFGSTLNGATTATFRAGTAGNVIWTGAVGNSVPPTNLIFTSANQLQVGGNVTVTGANLLNLSIPVLLIGSSTMTYSTSPLSVTFGTTLNGAYNLIIQGGAGTATFTGAVGGITPLASLTVVSSNIVQNSTVVLTGALSYTGSSSLNGNITTSAGSVTMTGPVALTPSVSTLTIDTTNSGTFPAGASILFSGGTSTINGARSLTLNAGSGGSATFGGAIGNSSAPINVLVSNASAVSIGANISATSFTITPAAPVTLAGSSTITTTAAANGISIPGTINGTSPTSQSLTLAVSGTDTASILNNVGNLVRLGALTISTGNAFSIGPSVTTINVSSMTVSGSIPTILNNIALLTIDANVSGGSISFGGTINGATAGVQSLTLTADNTISLAANVGSSTRLNAFSIGNGGTNFSIGAAMTEIRANTISVGTTPTTLNNTGTLTLNTSDNNGDISFASTINGTHALTFNPGTGNVSLQGAVGNSSALGAINLTNAGNFTAASTINAASFTQTAGSGTTTFQGALSFSGVLSLTGNQFTFSAPLLSASQATINNAGLLSISSSATMQVTGNFQQTGVGSVQTAGPILTASNISWNSGVTLTGNVNWTATTNVTMSSTVNGGSGLTINAGAAGLVTFASTVGQSTPLSSLVVNATGGIQVGGNQSVSSGPMSYNGPVTLTTNATFNNQGSSATTFSYTGTSLTGNRNASITAPNTSISVYGDVNLSGSAGSASGTLTASSGTGLTFGGQILTKGGNALAAGAGGNVSLTCTGGSISFHNINTSGGAGTSGGNAGNITIQPASGYTAGFPDGIIVVNSDLSGSGNIIALAGAGTPGSGGIVTFSAGRSAAATVATIASSVGGNSINISCDQFVMGPYEAMTALGDIALFAVSNVTLGDIVALNSITIISPLANLNIHGDEQILSSTGVLYTSPSLHFLGGSGYANSATLSPDGPLNAQDLGYSSSYFRPLLLYGDPIVLNFDTAPIPTPTPTVFASSTFVIYQLTVADAQLSDLLPIYDVLCPPLYRHKSDRNCRKFL